jgi:hypothetical protein
MLKATFDFEILHEGLENKGYYIINFVIKRNNYRKLASRIKNNLETRMGVSNNQKI